MKMSFSITYSVRVRAKSFRVRMGVKVRFSFKVIFQGSVG